MHFARWAALSLATAGAAIPARARADEPPPVPVRIVDRPLTLPAGVLRGDLVGGHLAVGPVNAVYATLSGGYGLTRDLELDATVLPVPLAPAFQYGSPAVSATYRFLDGRSLELGGTLGATWIAPVTAAYQEVTLTPAVPALVHLGSIRIDAAIAVPVTLGGPSAQVGLSVPLSVTFELSGPAYLGATTGFGVQTFAFFSSAYSPVGAFVGDAFPLGCRALLDVRAAVDLPEVIMPALHGGLVTNDYEVDLLATIYWEARPDRCAARPPPK